MQVSQKPVPISSGPPGHLARATTTPAMPTGGCYATQSLSSGLVCSHCESKSPSEWLLEVSRWSILIAQTGNGGSECQGLCSRAGPGLQTRIGHLWAGHSCVLERLGQLAMSQRLGPGLGAGRLEREQRWREERWESEREKK